MQRSVSLFFCRRCTPCLFDIKTQIINSFQYGVSNVWACNTTGIQECHTFFSDIICCVNKANTQSKFVLVMACHFICHYAKTRCSMYLFQYIFTDNVIANYLYYFVLNFGGYVGYLQFLFFRPIECRCW